ncbi:MAG: helix-turn-helix transcriptional regulator [Nonlabens sp.]|uniref:helix-turn-helix transcriptional regulator n=1 Tax=Nonlabens sp. TaxID=1888209 RepID=UPI003EF73B76
MKSSIELHKNELRATSSIVEQDLQAFLENFEKLANNGINSNSIYYVLNLQTMKYDFISSVCQSFTGLETHHFYDKGIDILADIMLPKDLKALSNNLFPSMNASIEDLSLEDRQAVVFEIHYHMVNNETGKVTPVVEYSSYANFDKNGNPGVSTGICYESIFDINGVRGLVRVNREASQETIFDQTIHYSSYVLTKTEKKIVDHMLSGKTKDQIAELEFVSPHTVKTHIKNIYKKLDINKLSELMSYFSNN